MPLLVVTLGIIGAELFLGPGRRWLRQARSAGLHSCGVLNAMFRPAPRSQPGEATVDLRHPSLPLTEDRASARGDDLLSDFPSGRAGAPAEDPG